MEFNSEFDILIESQMMGQIGNYDLGLPIFKPAVQVEGVDMEGQGAGNDP